MLIEEYKKYISCDICAIRSLGKSFVQKPSPRCVSIFLKFYHWILIRNSLSDPLQSVISAQFLFSLIDQWYYEVIEGYWFCIQWRQKREREFAQNSLKMNCLTIDFTVCQQIDDLLRDLGLIKILSLSAEGRSYDVET